MSLSLADAKKAWLKAAVGYPGAPSSEDDITQLEFLFYSANSGLTPVNKYTVTDHKAEFLRLKTGISVQLSPIETLERYWWRNNYSALGVGSQQYSYADSVLDFYLNHPYAGL